MGDEQSFGRQLKTYRARLGVTQEQLAEVVGLSVETIKRYEGNRLIPADATARRLAEKCGLSPGTKEFIEFVQLARHPLPSSALPSRAQSRVRRTRERMLTRVHDFWIKDVLEKSLDGTGLIHLTLEYQPSSVAYRWDGVLKAPEETTQPLAPSQTIVDVFDNQDGKLLILGPSGSGKTTMLLDLARSLLTRAEQQESFPIPVVFNLSSWADRRLSMADWLADELSVRYDVPRKIGAEWIEGDKLLLLLDGLDEVDRQYRTACIDAINAFQINHEIDLVVCSRLADYEELSTKLRLAGR